MVKTIREPSSGSAHASNPRRASRLVGRARIDEAIAARSSRVSVCALARAMPGALRFTQRGVLPPWPMSLARRQALRLGVRRQRRQAGGGDRGVVAALQAQAAARLHL
jgi:hypothetical protein